MKSLVKVMGVQIEPKICDKKANIEKVEVMLNKYSWFKPDLIVLPEVFLTGIFSPDVCQRESEDVPGMITEKLSLWARQYNSYLIGGSIIESCKDGKCRNNSMLFSPEGKMIANYYKQHMFSHMGSREGEFCTPGCQTVVANTLIGNIGMTICYDLRFPELYRSLANNGAQILAVPAAWPSARQEHWITLNRARAIENQCFVIAVNQVGNVPPKRINAGNSMVIDPWGSVIASAGEKEGVMLAEINLEEVIKLREEFPILQDRNMNAYANVKVCEAK